MDLFSRNVTISRCLLKYLLKDRSLVRVYDILMLVFVRSFLNLSRVFFRPRCEGSK